MTPGPPPTPTAVLKLRGSHRAKSRPGEPTPEPAVRVVAPVWLSKSAKAKIRSESRRLRKVGLMTDGDRDALVVYCQTWGMYRQAVEFLEKHGTMRPVKDKSGQVVSMEPWPHVKMVKDLTTLLHRYQCEFGMTPSARTRVRTLDDTGKAGDGKPNMLRLG